MDTTTSDLNALLKSNWWSFVMLSVIVGSIAGRIRASRAEKELARREKLSKEERVEEDRVAWTRGQAKAARAQFVGEILGILLIFAMCVGGL